MSGNKDTIAGEIGRVSETINFAAEEEITLEFWKEQKVFENCLKHSQNKPKYTFYDGPPFATGLPHYGHILAGTIKDCVTRYAHQNGYHVDRRFGWDCHGLPVEYEIDKSLGISGPDDVARMGITAYNNECRKIVMRYAKEWENIIGRMGRWIDFKNDYKTLYPWYMESIWWVFKQIYNKGLVYQGVKVMPYSTACTTALSNFETGQNYKEVVDPSVVVSFRLLNSKWSEPVDILAWTTTPWTLPSNLSLCVNPIMIYVLLRHLESGVQYILAECRTEAIFGKDISKFEFVEKFVGSDLKGLKYEPLFNYFVTYAEKMKAHRVLCDGYVTDDSGTGIVHQAPYFGEDDFRICLANGIITRESEIICPVDASGCFTSAVTDFKGLYVKDADKFIISHLKSKNRLVQASQIKHNYPFCWRSDTPLIYKAVPSWFIRVEQMSNDLLKANEETYWVPEFVQTKRFRNWLKEARDWAFSRNRYWGTPIPLWVSDNLDEVVCIGSIAELQQFTNEKITDIHREYVDKIEIPSKIPGRPPLRRISEVFDCWFESGSMPFAQQHFPFENNSNFDQCFPADFIAEGIDQTRGWFYTLLVISTALFNRPPFKNLIVNGLVLASDGQKMSKRKKNYPDPMDIVNKYGADALRLYLINSPVVRAENLRFKEEGVRDVIKDVFLPWYNAYRFLLQNIDRYNKEEGKVFAFIEGEFHNVTTSLNFMDSWILSCKESILAFVATEMKAYRLYTVVPRLTKFIDQLTNWYVRLNRRRIKGELGSHESLQSLSTLFDVLNDIVKLMAPFTPYLSEYMYQRLSKLIYDKNGRKLSGISVHYEMISKPVEGRVNVETEQLVANMQSVIELGRVIRDRKAIPLKYPVQEVVVIHKNELTLSGVKSLETVVLTELNARKLTICSDRIRYGISLRAEPDHKTLGLRLKNDFKTVMAALKGMNDIEIQESLNEGYFKINNHHIELDEVRIIYCLDPVVTGGEKYEAHSDNVFTVLIDFTPTEELQNEGLAREIINRVQKLKKKAHLVPTDPVLVYFTTPSDSPLSEVCKLYKEFIEAAIKSPFLDYQVDEVNSKPFVIEENFDLKGFQFKITICLPKACDDRRPSKNWVFVLLDNIKPRYKENVSSTEGIVLLEDYNGNPLTYDQLRNEIDTLFGLYGIHYFLLKNGTVLGDLNGVQSGDQLIISRHANTSVVSNKRTVNNKFANAEHNGRKCTIILENPKGEIVHKCNEFLLTALKTAFSGIDTNNINLD